MPLKSAAQAAYLKHHEPEVYREFAAKTPKGKKLPRYVSPKARREAFERRKRKKRS